MIYANDNMYWNDLLYPYQYWLLNDLHICIQLEIWVRLNMQLIRCILMIIKVFPILIVNTYEEISELNELDSESKMKSQVQR